MHDHQGYFDLLAAMVKVARRDARSKDAAMRQDALNWLYGGCCDLLVGCGVSDETWYRHVDELTEKAA